jgi:hypothetical protein
METDQRVEFVSCVEVNGGTRTTELKSMHQEGSNHVIESDTHESNGPNFQQRDGNMCKRAEKGGQGQRERKEEK